MGYFYCILITGVRNHIQKNLYYMSNGGSYGFAKNHYFVNHRINSYTYTGKQKMGEEQYLFTYDGLKADYNRRKNEIKSELVPIVQKINKEEITWKKLLKLKSTYESQGRRRSEFKELVDESLIDEMISVCEHDISVFVSPFGELKRYYKECKKHEDEGYTDIKLIFGFSH